MNLKMFWNVLAVTCFIGLVVVGKAFGADCALHLDNPGGSQVDSIPRWLSLGSLVLLSSVLLGLRRNREKLEKNNKDHDPYLKTGSASCHETPLLGTWAQRQMALVQSNRDFGTSLKIPQPAVRIARKRALANNSDGWSLLSQPHPTPNRPSESGRQNVSFFITPDEKKIKIKADPQSLFVVGRTGHTPLLIIFKPSALTKSNN